MKYVIPEFKADTIQRSFCEKEFEAIGILQPIQNSKWDLELRLYYDVVGIGFGSAVIIKGDRDSLFAEAYYYRLQWDRKDTIAPPGFKTIKYLKRNLYYSVKHASVPDTLMRALIKNKLFSRPDIFVLRDSLVKQGVKIEPWHALDPYFLSFTLKVKDKFRRFGGFPALFYANKGIKDFAYDVLLFNDFNNLYDSSGQERNHLFPVN